MLAFVESLPPNLLAPNPTWQTFLAFDYGVKRTGVAMGTKLLRHAKPLHTIHAQGKDCFTQAQSYIKEWQPDALVVGIPFHPDGAEHENTQRARKFMRGLHGRFGLAVFGVDERYTTTEALTISSDEKEVDALSAAIILEQFLRNLP